MKKFSLIGVDGNAFAIMAYVQSAMKTVGYNKKQIADYIDVATSGDYNNLLAESVAMIDEVNKHLN